MLGLFLDLHENIGGSTHQWNATLLKSNISPPVNQLTTLKGNRLYFKGRFIYLSTYLCILASINF